MKKSLLIKFLALISAALLCMPLFSACNNNNGIPGLISSITPDDMNGSLVTASSSFDIKTTSSVDKDTLLNSLSISPDADYNIDGMGTSFKLRFNSALTANTVYNFSSKIGGRTVYSWAFQTSPDFYVTKTELPTKAGEKELSFTFSYSDVENFEENFSVSPALSGKFTHNGSKWTFTANDALPFETQFTVTLKKSLSAADGLSLKEDYTVKFTTAEPSGDFASLLRDGDDYAGAFLQDDAPTALIKYRGLDSKKVSAAVYKFDGFKQYLEAHKTYFEAPDFTDIDALLSSLAEQSEFETELIDYPDNTNSAAEQTSLSKGVVIYPANLPGGYYITKLNIDKYTLYHVFQVTGLSVAAINAANTLNVWVNSVKTGKPLTDTEVILDNKYDERTNENGVAVFNLSNDNVSGRYAVIDDPKNPDVPYIAYISINGDYTAIKSANDYNCALYTDKSSYLPKDTVQIFGIAAPLSGGSAAGNCKVKINNREISVSPDKNGAFSVDYTLDGSLSGKTALSLHIGDDECASTDITISSKQENGEKSAVDEIFISASVIDGEIRISADNITSSYSDGLEVNEAASEKYSDYIYTKSTADIDFTLSVIKHTFFRREKAGQYFDAADNELKTKYKYTRINEQTVENTLSGKTSDGKASLSTGVQNKPQQGIYYTYKISYKSGGKTKTYEYDGGFAADSVKIYDNTLYTVSLDKTKDLSFGETVSGVLTRGDEIIKNGQVLVVPAYYNAISNKSCSADSISVKTDSKFAPNTVLLFAYFDGKHIYNLNRTNLSFDTKNALSITAKTDKQEYSNGDTVTLDIAVKNESGKGVAAPVLVYVYEGEDADSYTSSAGYSSGSSIDPQKYINETASFGDFGIDFKADPKAEKSAYSTFNGKKADPVYFGYAAADNSGKTTVTFTANTYGKTYYCYATAFSGFNLAHATATAVCSQKALLDISVNSEFTVEDDIIISIKSNIDADQGTEDKYSAELLIYSKASKGENEFDDKLKVKTASVSSEAADDSKINAGKLSKGAYSYRLDYKYGDISRTVSGEFTITAQNLSFTPSISALKDNKFQLDKSDTTVSVTLYSEEYAILFEQAAALYDIDADNVCKAAAKNSARHFLGIEKSNDTSEYQSGGISLNSKASADLTLSALCAAVSPDSFNKSQLAEYFAKYKNSDNADEQLAAYLGLSALSKPVLNTLYSFSEKSDELSEYQRILLALSFASIGDYSSAVPIYDEITASIDFDNPESINISEINANESAALISVLSSKLNTEYADEMLEYVCSDNFKSQKCRFEYLCYAQYIESYVYTGGGKVTVNVSSADGSKDISFYKSEFTRLNLSPDDITSTYLGSDDSVYACALYTVIEKKSD